eukprot:scaffold168163_cov32-Tisochrysis_lutea.AAC.6
MGEIAGCRSASSAYEIVGAGKSEIQMPRSIVSRTLPSSICALTDTLPSYPPAQEARRAPRERPRQAPMTGAPPPATTGAIGWSELYSVELSVPTGRPCSTCDSAPACGSSDSLPVG